MEELYNDLERTFQSDQVDEDNLTEKILAVILILYLLGGGYEDESELTNEDKKKLEETYQLVLSTTAGMVDRHARDVDMQATIERIYNYVYGVFFYSLSANNLSDTVLYSWLLGDTDHCVDCLEQATKGAMPGTHWKQMADLGIYPRSPQLFCTGLHCQCELQ